MNEQLDKKANKVSVANALQRKANKQEIDAALETKADLIDLEKICGILEHKIDNADIENALK